LKARAVALLLVAFVFTGARQQNGAPQELYAEARLAFDRGELGRAIQLGKDGQRQFGDDQKWRELFTIVLAESLGRSKIDDALTELRLAPRSRDPEASVRLEMAYGFVRDGESKYAKADEIAATVMPSLRPEIAVRRAGSAMRRDDADAMERFVREAIEHVDPVAQPFVYANARLAQANTAMKRGDYQEAVERFDRVLRFAHVVGAKGPASITAGNRGYAYLRLGDTQEALSGFEEAQQMAKELGNAAVQATWLANIAGVYIAQQQFERALHYAQESVAVAETLGEAGRIALTLSNLAQVEIELGRYADARKHNEQALELYRHVDLPSEQQFALLNQARIDGATGAPDAALKDLARLAASKDLPLRWNAQAIMARIYRAQGQPGEAERMYKAALDTGDQARVDSKFDNTYLFAFEANLIRFYDEWITLLLESRRVEDALLVAERSRARTLRQDAAQETLPPPSAVARAHDATILYYWLMPQRSLLWVVTAHGTSVVELLPGPVIEKEVEAYRSEILRAITTEASSARGARLFQMLIAPAVPAIRSPRVVVIADAALGGMNLEALVVQKPKPHYWIEDVTLSYAPSLHLLQVPPFGGSLRNARVLVMGDVPDQGADFPHLARAGAEVELVAKHFDRRRSLVLTGADATPSAYLTSDLRSYPLIHFAAHSTANVHSPLESSVILAQGGRLTGHAIVAAPLAAELVTLSSCNSAGRRSYAGEGLVGLAWAFLDAGAHRVVAAQWEVSDWSTPKLMDHMYAALARGSDPAVALREAKLALVHSNSVYNRPFYWAPFILYGAP
jgi:CHAT domain-containing protein